MTLPRLASGAYLAFNENFLRCEPIAKPERGFAGWRTDGTISPWTRESFGFGEQDS